MERIVCILKFKIKRISKKIHSSISNAIQGKNAELPEKIRGLGNANAAVGMLGSGRHAVQSRDLILKHLGEIYDIISTGINSYVKNNKAALNSDDIHYLMNSLAKEAIDFANVTLREQVMLASSNNTQNTQQVENMLTELNFDTLLSPILTQKVNECETKLLPIEANITSENSKKISNYSFLIALLALIISLRPEIRRLFDWILSLLFPLQ
ncbi:MAG: hypothetical protein JSR17_04465 [Proteobacteria bacterium]|nr:hypothetical protein [Pseudomonadota bacterium]